MLNSVWPALPFLGLALSSAIPSPLQAHSDRTNERHRREDCFDFGAVENGRNKPQPDPLSPKQPDGICCGSKPYVNYQWVITEKNIIVQGGCKFMHVVNDVWPPPQIVVEHGTVIKLEMINRLASDPITLHAHGLDQKASQWMDGPESVIQR